MADMTASGWYASNVRVIKSWRGWGPGVAKQSLVEMVLEATNFGGGAHLYPGDGIPAPAPSLVGFQHAVEYIIPVSPFHGTTAAARWIPWGCVPPTFGASGGTVSTGAKIRMQGLIGATPSGGPTYMLEQVSTAASTLFSTDTYRAFGIFVGR